MDAAVRSAGKSSSAKKLGRIPAEPRGSRAKGEPASRFVDGSGLEAVALPNGSLLGVDRAVPPSLGFTAEDARDFPPGFDPREFEATVANLLRQRSLPQVEEPVESIPAESIPVAPAPGTAYHARCLQVGVAALPKLALVILGGGKNSRFGEGIKSIYPIFQDEQGRSIHSLGAKLLALRQLEATYGVRIPVHVQASRETVDTIRGQLASEGFFPEFYLQREYPRLTEDGKLYRDANGKLEWIPAGHGDFFRAFRPSAEALRTRGYQHLFFSNADNFLGVPDPVLLGHFILSGKAMMSEMTDRIEGESGASPVIKNGIVQLDEKGKAPLIGPHNLYFQLDALLGEPIVPPYRWIEKPAPDGGKKVQLEQVTSDAAGLADSQGRARLPMGNVRVPRDARFAPIKVKEDLAVIATKFGNRLRELMALRSAQQS